MNKTPKSKCLVCRLVHQMDEVRKHPNQAGVWGVQNKLDKIREYGEFEHWCEEHLASYRDVTYIVEHWMCLVEKRLHAGKKPANTVRRKVVMSGMKY